MDYKLYALVIDLLRLNRRISSQKYSATVKQRQEQEILRNKIQIRGREIIDEAFEIAEKSRLRGN